MNAAHPINPDDYEATLIFPSLLLSVHTASLPLSSQRPQQIAQNFHILGKITTKPPALPLVEHAGAHILNTSLFKCKYARVYLGEPNS